MEDLRNDSRPWKRRKRVGRGPGSGMGKTSGRGHKGAGSRSGYRRRHGYEGGQMRLFQKLPKRGFTRGRWEKRLDVVNIEQIERFFADGEVLNEESLRKHGLLSGPTNGVKLLGKGTLTKKIAGCQLAALSASARAQLEAAGVPIS